MVGATYIDFIYKLPIGDTYVFVGKIFFVCELGYLYILILVELISKSLFFHRSHPTG
jgi:hypothetical protein